jgi:glutamyl-tRNA reductase
VRDTWPGQDPPELLLLSTCNRTECLFASRADLVEVRTALFERLRLAAGVAREEIEPVHFVHEGLATVCHLGHVAAGADSMVFGESEILGQLRAALEHARAAGAAGPVLIALVEHALRAGRRVRRETAIGRCSASVASEALRVVAEQVDVASARVLLLGAGDVARTAGLLLARRARSIGVVARRVREGEDLARAIGGHALPWHDLPMALRDADVVFSATSAPHVLITPELVHATRGAEARPLSIVDLSMPRNVDPEVGRLPGVTFCDLDDLEQRVERNLAARRETLPAVQAIVAREAERFVDWHRRHSVRPVLSAMHSRSESIRRAEIERLRGRLGGLDPAVLEAIEHFSRSLINRLLQEPSRQVREDAASATAARRLFGLEDPA